MKAKNSIAIYRRLLEYIKPYRWTLIAAILCMLVFSVFNGLCSFAVYVITKSFSFIQEGTIALDGFPQFKFDSVINFPLYLAPIILIVVFASRGLFSGLSNWLMAIAGLKAVLRLRDKMYDHIVRLSLNYFDNKKTGDLMSRILTDTGHIQNSVSSVMVDLVKQPLAILFGIPGIIIFGGKLALIGLVTFPLVVIPIAIAGRKIRKVSRRVNEARADAHSILQETLQGVRVVKAFNMEDHESNKFHDANQGVFAYFKRTILTDEVQRITIELLGAVGGAFALWYAISQQMDLSQIGAFLAALYVMYEPVKKISKVNSNIQQALAAGERVFEVLDAESSIQDLPGATDFEEELQEVYFDHVHFAYDQEPILKNIDLKVNRGEVIAIVGSSGAGKTTLVNLVPRFYDPTSGMVRFNHQDIRMFTKRSIREQIGIVSQETILFNGTVSENIAYGRKDASLEDIRKAAKAAHALEFVERMEEQFDTKVGERGMTLSGGQRQRVAIARALLKNPPILILDEATSQLDTESERQVQQALDILMQGRTVFVIAHRLSTIQKADKILVMDEGEIVQVGRHSQLVGSKGRYKELYDLQFSA